MTRIKTARDSRFGPLFTSGWGGKRAEEERREMMRQLEEAWRLLGRTPGPRPGFFATLFLESCRMLERPISFRCTRRGTEASQEIDVVPVPNT